WMWMAGPTPTAPRAQNAPAGTDPNQLIADLIKQGGGAAVVTDGNVIRLEFSMPGAQDVETSTSISSRDGRTAGAVVVTIKSEQPPVVTKAGYEKIRAGMMYPQVAEALEGEMTKGRMGEGSSGELGIVQGSRRIDLTFADSEVTNKSAKGLE